MDDKVLQEIAHGVTWWMEAASKSINVHESILLKLCHRVLEPPIDAGTGMTCNGAPIDQPVTEAINHPVGLVTQALINLWLKQSPNDNDLLPDEIKSIFTKLCNVQESRFRHGRVLLGSRLIPLFRADRIWTEKNLLPLFSWSNSTEAKAVWEGFLWSPRLYEPVLTALKKEFLESANHYEKLGEHRRQFAMFITYAALNQIKGYDISEFRSAIGKLPQEGLEESAKVVYQSLEGASEQCENYWKNHVEPFWREVWPKSIDRITPRISTLLARLAIAARGEFPTALAAVKDWLYPIKDIQYEGAPVNQLHQSDLCKRFPEEALQLLDAVTADYQWQFVHEKFGECLDQIVQAKPCLEQDKRYERLRKVFDAGGKYN